MRLVDMILGGGKPAPAAKAKQRESVFADLLFERFPPPPPVGVGRVNRGDKPGPKARKIEVAGPSLAEAARKAEASKVVVDSEGKKVFANTLRAQAKKRKTLDAIRAGYNSTTKISSRTGIAVATILKYTDELEAEGLIEIERLPPGFKVRRYKAKGGS